MLSFEIDESPSNAAWDAFVERSADAHIEQTTAWAAVKRSQGWQAYRVLVRKHAELIGGAQVLHRRVKKLASVGYISSGPVAGSPDDYGAVTEQLMRALRRSAHTYQVVVPNYAWTGIVPVLTANGFFPKPNALPPTNLVTATLMIDLTQDQETILAHMNETTRRSIRRSARELVEVAEGGAQDVGAFHRLMSDLCARRGIAPRPATVEESQEIWRRLAPHGMVKVFLARYQAEDVCAALALICGGTVRAWKIGWSGRHAQRNPNHALLWGMIQWAKASGLKRFDFDQILPEHARAVLRGETIDDHYWGVTQFKLGFGGELHMVPDAYYRSFSGPVQMALRLGGAKLAARPGLLERLPWR